MYEFHVRNHCLVGEISYITLGNICIFLHEVNQTFIIFECLNLVLHIHIQTLYSMVDFVITFINLRFNQNLNENFELEK